MKHALQVWFRNLPISDPMRRRQALVVQAIILIIIGSCVLGLITSLLTIGQSGNQIVPVVSYSVLLALTVVALTMLRRGQFSTSVAILVISLIASIGLALVAVGIEHSESIVMSFTAPIVVAGMTLGRRGLFTTAGMAVGFIGVVAVLSALDSNLVGFATNEQINPMSWASTIILVVCALTLLLDRFRLVLRDALDAAMHRQHELERLQASLEQLVSERTASLEMALQEGEQRETHLEQALADLQASRTAIRELSAPVIPVLPGVLVMPLVGALDEQRASDFAQNLLQSVERQGARYAIIDITGVPLVDTHVAKTVIGAAAAIRLLGATTLLVGIRPEVAQTLVSLGVDLGNIATFANLQEAVVSLQSQHER